jgi:hypothetical protein
MWILLVLASLILFYTIHQLRKEKRFVASRGQRKVVRSLLVSKGPGKTEKLYLESSKTEFNGASVGESPKKLRVQI